jgi:hypothetical protein
MRSNEWNMLRERFQFRCGYCGVKEKDRKPGPSNERVVDLTPCMKGS